MGCPRWQVELRERERQEMEQEAELSLCPRWREPWLLDRHHLVTINVSFPRNSCVATGWEQGTVCFLSKAPKQRL